MSIVSAGDKRPVSQAFSVGSGGGGACPRFGPGFGVQTFASGLNLSLPLFRDIDCVNILQAQAIASYAGPEAAIQFLARKYPDINAAVTQARTSHAPAQTAPVLTASPDLYTPLGHPLR